MQNDKVLTIAIPTFNMENYIARCIESLLIKENFQLLQIIIVNDGSRDRSSHIAHEYADKYPCSIAVIDKDNGNYGSCINAAIQVASGKYIKILDSDDYFNISDLEKVVKRLKDCDSDAILTNHTIITPKNKHIWKHNYIDGQCIILEKECPSYFPMHSIIYRTSMLREINYSQTEGISYTDQEWIFYPMLNASQMVYMDLNLYQYCMDRVGQTMDPKVFAKGLPMLYTILFRALDYRNAHTFENNTSRISYCDMQLFKQAETIYRQELIYNSRVGEMVSELDLKIKEINPTLYNELDSLSIGFRKYVDHFRKTGCGISIIDRHTIKIQCKIINLLSAIRNRINRIYG